MTIRSNKLSASHLTNSLKTLFINSLIITLSSWYVCLFINIYHYCLQICKNLYEIMNIIPFKNIRIDVLINSRTQLVSNSSLQRSQHICIWFAKQYWSSFVLALTHPEIKPICVSRTILVSARYSISERQNRTTIWPYIALFYILLVENCQKIIK